MATTARLPRCPFPGCPWRWTTPGGRDRPCPDHDDQRMLDDAARSLGIDLAKAPGDRDDGGQVP